MNSKYNKEYLKYQKKYLNLLELAGGATSDVKYQLTQYDLFDTVTYMGKPYLVINKDYENGFYSLVDEQTGEQINADEEMLKIKSAYVQKKEPPREQPTEAPVLQKRVTYADQEFKPNMSVSQQKKQQKVNSEEIANSILQEIHPSLTLKNNSYPPTLDRAFEIIEKKVNVLDKIKPIIPVEQIQQVITLVEDRIEKMYRLTALKNIQNPPEAVLGNVIESPEEPFQAIKEVVDPVKINYGKRSEYKRKERLAQVLDSRPKQVTYQTLKAVDRQRQVQQLEDRFKSLPRQISDKIVSDLGPGNRYDPNYFSILQEQIPVTERKNEDKSIREMREFDRMYVKRQTKPFKDLESDSEKYKIATSGLSKSQRKKKYKALNKSRLESFRKEQGLPKSLSYQELQDEYDFYMSIPEPDYDY